MSSLLSKVAANQKRIGNTALNGESKVENEISKFEAQLKNE